MIASAYGSWTSLITSDLVVAAAIRLDQIALDARTIYWIEFSREARTKLHLPGRRGWGGELVTPDDANAFNVRTRAHEYGGGGPVPGK